MEGGDCDYWGFGGAILEGLRAGIAITVRASAPGYFAQEITLMPTPIGEGMRATIFSLPESQLRNVCWGRPTATV